MICRECGKEIESCLDPEESDCICVTSGTIRQGKFQRDELPSVFYHRACFNYYTPEEVFKLGDDWFNDQPYEDLVSA